MAMQPMAMYGLEVPAGDVAISARPEIPSAFRITMAAIDPSAEPEGEEDAPPRATLKVIRQSILDDFDDSEYDDESDDGFDEEEMERILAGAASDESDESDEEAAGAGPSDPARSKKVMRAAMIKQALEQEMDLDDDDEDDDDEEMPNGVNGITKSAKALGKMPVSDEDEDDDSEELLSEGEEVEEFVICTLDPAKLYQQPLDITFGEDERVWFKVSGTHSIFLTGNYVEPASETGLYDPDSDEGEEYDLEPDMDEIDDEDLDEVDELDDMEDPRVVEMEDSEDEAPALIKAPSKTDVKKDAKKNKHKRPAPDSADEEEADVGAEGLDEMIAKEAIKVAQEPVVNGDQKLSKNQLKKLKKNNGAAAAAPVVDEKDVLSSQKSDKKVSFAKELEQGPTPTKAAEKAPESKPKSAASSTVKVIQGVTIDDKRIGKGQAAKSGDRVGMRYIGKLKSNNEVFDSNKKGKPFSFKLGTGECIKGWDIGVTGMQVGGERRITVPAHLAYGSKKMGVIPPNSALVFDIKLLEIK